MFLIYYFFCTSGPFTSREKRKYLVINVKQRAPTFFAKQTQSEKLCPVRSIFYNSKCSDETKSLFI